MSDYQRLKLVMVQGFRSLADVNLEIRPLNILIGPNGAGKSNFVSLFTFIRNIVNGHLQLYTGVQGGANKLLYYGAKTTSKMELAFSFPPNHYRAQLVPTSADRFVFGYEACYFDKDWGPGTHGENINSGGEESRLGVFGIQPQGSVPKYVLQALQSWRVYHFHDTSAAAGVKQSVARYDNLVLKEDASNLAAFLLEMQENEAKNSHYKRLVRTIQLVIPFFKDFLFRPAPTGAQMLQLEWQDRNSPDTVFNAHDLSDGSLRFICLAALLLQPDLPSLILLDEPELGLHPSAIHVLAGLLRRASDRATVIASTQSVNLVNEFDADDIIVVDRNERGASTFTRQHNEQLKQWLERYSLGELWEKNVIGGTP
ncbi:MAG TPA: AAA family ATPase [Hymenobacter sp.]